MRSAVRGLAAAVVVGLLAAGCEPERAFRNPQPAEAVGNFVGSWRLVEGRGPDGEIAILGRYPITLELRRKSFGGVAACNDYGARLRMNALHFEARGLAANQMGCLPHVNQAETKYFAAIMAVESAALEGKQLVLSGPDARLTFEPVKPAPVEKIADQFWGLVSPALDAERGDRATFTIHSDGTFDATTGCHDLRGTWMRQGAAIVFPELSNDDSRCPRDGSDTSFGVGFLTEGFIPRLRADGRLLIESTSGPLRRYVFMESTP